MRSFPLTPSCAALALLLGLAAGCPQTISTPGDDDDASEADADGDGHSPPADCDDDDPAVYPGAPEVCDNEDQDCNGIPDNGFPTQRFYLDADGDGVSDGVNYVIASQCAVPEAPWMNWVEGPYDCNDLDPSVHPGAPETCDSLDNDCDGVVDEDCPPAALGELEIIAVEAFMPSRGFYELYHSHPGDEERMVADCFHYVGDSGDQASAVDFSYEVTTSNGVLAEEYLSWCRLDEEIEDDVPGFSLIPVDIGRIVGSYVIFDYPIEIEADGYFCHVITCSMGATDESVTLTASMLGIGGLVDSLDHAVPVDFSDRMNGGPPETDITVYLDPRPE